MLKTMPLRVHFLYKFYLLILSVSSLKCASAWNITHLEFFTPNNNMENHLLKNLQDIQKTYIKDKQKEWMIPTIKNLDSYLAQISGNRNCFMILDNFQNANLEPNKIPVILRSPKPFLNTYLEYTGHGWRILFGSSTFRVENVYANRSLKYFKCATSKYIRGMDPPSQKYVRQLCLSINMIEYFLGSKPLPCYMHLEIFPPNYLLDSDSSWVSHPLVFEMIFKHHRFHFYTPYTIPPIHIRTKFQQSYEESEIESQRIRKWIDAVRESYGSDVSRHDIFIILNIHVTKFQGPLNCSNGYVKVVHVLRICYNCRADQDGYYYGTITKSETRTLERSVVERKAFPNPGWNIAWDICPRNDIKSLASQTLQEGCNFQQKKSYKQLWIDVLQAKSILEKVATVHSQVLNSVMGNFSLYGFDQRTNRKQYPIFLISVEPEAYDRTLLTYRQYTNDIFTTLRFIGCGRQGMTSFPFNVLLNVYDAFVWIGIIAIISAVPFSIWLIRTPTEVYIDAFSVLKILLEQGSPFSESLLCKIRYQILCSFPLLMGIVLSNAYKNNNIYNMVLPRAPILYNKFSELLRDNFKIYTRTAYVHLEYSHNPQAGVVALDMSFENKSIVVETELEDLSLYADSKVDDDGYTRRNGSLHKYGVMQAATLHPQVKTMFVDFLEKKIRSFQENMLEPGKMLWIVERMLSQIHRELQAIEKPELIKSIKKCQQTAILLPDYICREIKKVLVRKDKMQHVFIGEESFTDLDWTFGIAGDIPPFVIKRIHGIAESGVWQWWVRLLRRNEMHDVDKHDVVRAVGISGNIVILFVVWSGGVFLAILYFIIELCKFLVLQKSCCQITVIDINVKPFSIAVSPQQQEPSLQESKSGHAFLKK